VTDKALGAMGLKWKKSDYSTIEQSNETPDLVQENLQDTQAKLATVQKQNQQFKARNLQKTDINVNKGTPIVDKALHTVGIERSKDYFPQQQEQKGMTDKALEAVGLKWKNPTTKESSAPVQSIESEQTQPTVVDKALHTVGLERKNDETTIPVQPSTITDKALNVVGLQKKNDTVQESNNLPNTETMKESTVPDTEDTIILETVTIDRSTMEIPARELLGSPAAEDTQTEDMKTINTDNLKTTSQNNEEVMEEKEKDQTASQPSFFSKMMGKVLETVGGAVGISPKQQKSESEGIFERTDEADSSQLKEKEKLQLKQEQDGSYEGLGVGRMENSEAQQIHREKEV